MSRFEPQTFHGNDLKLKQFKHIRIYLFILFWRTFEILFFICVRILTNFKFQLLGFQPQMFRVLNNIAKIFLLFFIIIMRKRFPELKNQVPKLRISNLNNYLIVCC
jgi:hypothetical protein